MKGLMRFFSVVFVLCVMSVAPLFAAGDGCDVENNDRIVPSLALCSTHVYNIGEIKNPDTTNQQAMRDVIALKTTVMTQQMNKQYEYLEAMIRRFKVQLEKAVLTTSLQAKGAASSDSSSSSFKQTDRNVYMAGVKNCNNELLPTDVMTCLNNNMNTISNLSGNADNVDIAMRRQLANDFKLLNATVVEDANCTSIETDSGKSCMDYANIAKKKDFQTCFDYMRACLRSKSYALTQAAQKKKQ